MADHTLVVRSDRRGRNGCGSAADRAHLWLTCPGCDDLTIHVTVGPTSQADHLIALLTDAHLRQMQGVDSGG